MSSPDPFVTLLEVLKHSKKGVAVTPEVTCSPCEGYSCERCSSTGKFLMSALGDDTPTWWHEAAILAQGGGLVGAQNRIIRRTVMPMLRARKALAQESVPLEARCATACLLLQDCETEDWRNWCLEFVGQFERGKVSIT